MKPKIAISVGDLNGVGIEIALKSHATVSKLCQPIYCISNSMLTQAAQKLNVVIPKDFKIHEVGNDFTIEPGVVSKESGIYSYDSFMAGVALCEKQEADAVVTLPINKEAWMMAGLEYKGHTDLLRKHFHKEAIMMLGCPQMYVALFTEHVPLKDVPALLTQENLEKFLEDFHASVGDKKVAVLGLNPHAGDNGVLGDEERFIEAAIAEVNQKVGKELFVGPIVPDVAFSPHFRKNFHYFVAMYHDQGLAPLKALHFDESVNISLNLPIIRTSVDHGTAFDIAYKNEAKTLSYINAIESALEFIQN